MQIPLHSIQENKLFIKWRDITIVPGSMEQAHRHDYFQFMFLQKVSGTHGIDFESYNAADKSLHFVGKGRVHDVDFTNDVIGGVLLFPEALFGSSESDLQLLSSLGYFKSGAHPILNLSETEFKQVSSLINNIKTTLNTQAFEMSKHLLFALLIQVRDIYNKKTNQTVSKHEPQELIQFSQLVKEYGRSWNNVEEFTNEIAISVTRLNSLCKKHYGKTALQLLHSRKLLEAKRMLVYTDKQVKEIAYDCGFDDVAYFNRFFKKHTNCTPLSFRNNH